MKMVTMAKHERNKIYVQKFWRKFLEPVYLEYEKEMTG
jgi:hypothetical protein